MKSYDELEEMLNEFMGSSFNDEDEEDEKPKKKTLKKKKYKGDI